VKERKKRGREGKRRGRRRGRRRTLGDVIKIALVSEALGELP